MRTQKQIEASRANGALSKGPITEEGKALAAKNLRRHDVLSSTLVLEGESDQVFTEMVEKLFAELEPITETETALVEQLASARWRQMRIWSVEKANLDKLMKLQKSGSGPDRLANVIESHPASLSAILRYDVTFSRMQTSFLRQFRTAKANRPADLDPNSTSANTWPTWKQGEYPGCEEGEGQ